MIHKLLFFTLQKIFSIPFFIIDLLSPTFYLKRLRTKIVEYKNGKVTLLALFMGEVMKLSKGKADPKVTTELVKKALEE